MKGLSKLGGGLGSKMSAGKPEMGKKEPKAEAAEHEREGEKASVELHDKGDGTSHTVINGEKTEHPDHMHAVAHIAHHLMPEGSHFHAHHDGFSMKSHGMHESGEHKETEEHNSPEEMHSAMDQMMGEGGQGGGEPEEAAGAEPNLGGFQG